ncbi:MAG: hypothetical protein ABIQ26_01355, partial [Streptosporangiaceae bacterium]
VIVLTDWMDNPLRAKLQADRLRKRLNEVIAANKNNAKAANAVTGPARQRSPAHLHLINPDN